MPDDNWRPIRGAGDRCLAWSNGMLLRTIADRVRRWNGWRTDFDRRANCVVYHQYLREAQRRGLI